MQITTTPSNTKECECGCERLVKIDGLGTALFESFDGIKYYVATESCRRRLLKMLHPKN